MLGFCNIQFLTANRYYGSDASICPSLIFLAWRQIFLFLVKLLYHFQCHIIDLLFENQAPAKFIEYYLRFLEASLILAQVVWNQIYSNIGFFLFLRSINDSVQVHIFHYIGLSQIKVLTFFESYQITCSICLHNTTLNAYYLLVLFYSQFSAPATIAFF